VPNLHTVPRALAGIPFTTAQARDAGVTRGELHGPSYRRVVHGVYVTADTPDTTEIRARAIGLVLPRGAVVGYRSAAWLHRADVRDRRDSHVEVIGQRGDQIRINGIRATSALLAPDDVTVVFDVPVTSRTRTAFDLARNPDLVEAVVGVDAMLNRGGAELGDLREYVASHRKWPNVRAADAALRHAEPLSQSPMESRQRMRLVLAGLPRPRAQAPVPDEAHPFAFIDNGYEQWKVGADYDGEPHQDTWRHDLERQEKIRDHGWWHRRYTKLHIMHGWAQMVEQVSAALLRAGWRPA
jgi:very-short-patch-repair endonuclease